MATMTVTSQSTNTTAYGSRLATLKVVGISTRSGHQTITVPLNRLSQKMQQIHRQGGKIISVYTGVSATVMPSPIESVEKIATAPTPTPEVSEAEVELAMEVPTPAAQPKQNNHSSKKKRR
jgi:CpcD/allophycocyanin linker domain